jgi:hypothetical protein
MAVLILLNALVYLHGDTLLFMEQDSIINKWIVSQDSQQTKSLMEKGTRKTKISSNNKFFMIYKERRMNYDSVQSEISFYDADRNEIYTESLCGLRKFDFRLSDIHDGLIILAETDKGGRDPIIYAIKGGKKEIIIEKGDWKRVVNYRISRNHRYLVLHARKLYMHKLWDYIYFVDLETKTDWEYLFPACLSCKRRKIDLDIEETGQVDVIYKNEHRIFSKEGKLINLFIDLK